LLTDCHWLGVDPRPLCGAHRNFALSNQGEESISIIKSWRQEGRPANKNKQKCPITRCRFDNWEPSNLVQDGKEGVVLFYINDNDIKFVHLI